MWIQIPFFCGASPQCWEPGSQWALDQAKQNLVRKYLVVGVTAEFEDFVEVLEFLLPEYFNGATEYLRKTGKAHIKRTKHKDKISEATEKKMKGTRVYQMEKEFYNFAVRHFKSIKKTVLPQKLDNKVSFVYEKIRPK
eukprot:TRINITY_DN19101_c0_g1_i1.p1 TRINITY_DN19101_c0_g1~~TRINITY_DN19101_c0_g1_i1.p1  ORF type:complete len:150 (-),score=30.59 TRINITY_DN19101_c0_g1_i1:16-429(-)